MSRGPASEGKLSLERGYDGRVTHRVESVDEFLSPIILAFGINFLQF